VDLEGVHGWNKGDEGVEEIPETEEDEEEEEEEGMKGAAKAESLLVLEVRRGWSADDMAELGRDFADMERWKGVEGGFE
jgi:hypothetical protein